MKKIHRHQLMLAGGTVAALLAIYTMQIGSRRDDQRPAQALNTPLEPIYTTAPTPTPTPPPTPPVPFEHQIPASAFSPLAGDINNIFDFKKLGASSFDKISGANERTASTLHLLIKGLGREYVRTLTTHTFSSDEPISPDDHSHHVREARGQLTLMQQIIKDNLPAAKDLLKESKQPLQETAAYQNFAKLYKSILLETILIHASRFLVEAKNNKGIYPGELTITPAELGEYNEHNRNSLRIKLQNAPSLNKDLDTIVSSVNPDILLQFAKNIVSTHTQIKHPTKDTTTHNPFREEEKQQRSQQRPPSSSRAPKRHQDDHQTKPPKPHKHGNNRPDRPRHSGR